MIDIDAAAKLDSMRGVDDGIYQALGERVSRLRRDLRITQETLGGRVGMSRATIANIEAGRQRVTLDQVYQLASALQLDTLGELVPVEIPRYEPVHAAMAEGLNPIQVSQIENILRSGLARANATRKRT